jgi:superfamily II DNA or RNA helicase
MSRRPNVDFHEGTLRVRCVTETFVSKALKGVPLFWDRREDCFRCDAMFAGALRDRMQSTLAGGVKWNVGRGRRQITIHDRRSMSLREDQTDAVSAFERSGEQGLVIMPTGTGKTIVAIEVIIRRQASALVVVPVRELMYQWHTRILQATGIDAGLIGDGVHRVSPISVTTYDSAAIHMHRIGDQFSLVIFDEVHHLSGRSWSDAARMSAATSRLGLTATPPGQDTALDSLQRLVGPVVFEQSIAAAKGKTLADYRVRRIAVKMTDEESKRYRELSSIVQRFVHEQRQLDSTFRWEETYKLAGSTDENPDRAKDANRALRAFRAKRRIEEHAAGKMRVLEDLFRLHAGDSVIVFTGSNLMAREVSLRFLIPCLLSHCAKRERREWLQGFAEHRYPVLVANRILDEGVDLPEAKIAIVLGGLSSQRQALQRLGRVLRKTATGQSAILYEVVTEDTKEVQRSRDRRRNDAYRKSTSRR